MKKLKRFVKAAARNFAEIAAPYVVINYNAGGKHFCFTRKDALSWMACYDANTFGTTFLYGFDGRYIASKGK